MKNNRSTSAKEGDRDQKTPISSNVQDALYHQHRDQYQKNSTSDAKQRMKEIYNRNIGKTFFEDIKSDVQGMEWILTGVENNNDPKKFDNFSMALKAESSVRNADNEKFEKEFFKQSTTLENMGVGVLKRAMLLCGACGMQITDNSGNTKSASENNLPISTYLSHGSRVLVQIPQDCDAESVMNWFTSGDSTKNGIAKSSDQVDALRKFQEGKADGIVYERYGSTHDTSYVRDKGGKVSGVNEEKGMLIGARDIIKNSLTGRENTTHFGVDLKGGVDPKTGKDFLGNYVFMPDGHHGHLYIHYKKGERGMPSSIMFGIEGGATYSSKHSWTGGSDPVSSLGEGGKKWKDLEITKQLSNQVSDIILPRKYNGMKVILDSTKISALTQMKDSEYGVLLASAMPCKNISEFNSRYHNNQSRNNVDKTDLVGESGYYIKDNERLQSELQSSSKNIMEIPKKLSLWKRILNSLTFGIIKPLRKEIEKYKDEKKKYKFSLAQETHKEDVEKKKSYKQKHSTEQTQTLEKQEAKNKIIQNEIDKKARFTEQVIAEREGKKADGRLIG